MRWEARMVVASLASVALGASCQAFVDVERGASVDAGTSDARALTDADIEATPGVDVEVPDAADGVEVFVTRDAALDGLVVDNTWAYWVEPGAQGRVVRCAVAKCEPQVIAAGQADPNQVAIFGTTVAWTTRGDGAVSVSIDGMPRVLNGGQDTSSLAVFGSSVYFNFRPGPGASVGSIAKCTLSECSGGSVIAAYEDAMPEQMHATNVGLAWVLSGNRLRACESCGMAGGIRDIVIDGDGVAAFTSDPDFFYVARSGGKGGAYAVPFAGGDAAELVSSATDIRSLAVDGNDLFYAQRVTGDVRAVARTGGPSRLLAARLGKLPHSLAVRGGSVYWIEGASIVRTHRP